MSIKITAYRNCVLTIWAVWLVVASSTTFCSPSDSTSASRAEIDIAIVEARPFFYHEDGMATGIFHDIIFEVCKRANLTPTFSTAPFRRNFINVLEGKSDAMLALRVPKIDRALYSKFSLGEEALLHHRVAIFGLQSKFTDQFNLRKMSEYHVGHIRMHPELHAALIPYSKRTSIFSNTRNLIKALMAERIDLAITTPSMLPSISNEHNVELSYFRILHEFPNQPVTMAWSETTDSKIIENFDKAVVTLRNQGRLDKIVSIYVPLKYFGSYSED